MDIWVKTEKCENHFPTYVFNFRASPYLSYFKLFNIYPGDTDEQMHYNAQKWWESYALLMYTTSMLRICNLIERVGHFLKAV